MGIWFFHSLSHTESGLVEKNGTWDEIFPHSLFERGDEGFINED